MRRCAGAAVIALSLSCNGQKDAAPGPGPSTPPNGSCAVETEVPADEGTSHVASCAPVRYLSQPPSSGTHYPSWAVFRVYDKPVPWGFLVHDLEHGAV
jgi:uncharacterized protein DUF3105